MRVLFIYPNLNAQIGFNYGVAFLSAVLRARGHITRLLNINEKLGYPLDWEAIRQDIQSFQPHLIGISMVSNQYQYCLEIAASIRKAFTVPIIGGGIHATADPEGVMASNCFDFLCLGEGEHALSDLVDRMENGQDCSTIPNLWVRGKGNTIRNKVAPFIDLTTLPPKDYEIFDFQKMIDAKQGWVGVMASRGCPYRCTYCFNHQMVKLYRNDLSAPGGRLHYIRLHPLDQVFKELTYLLNNYKNITTFIFDDDIFTLNKSYLLEFCERYRKEVKFPFVVNAHVKNFDEEKARALKDAGCIIVKFGLESGSEKVRRKILNRRMSNQEIIRSFEVAHQAGLHTSAFVMFGFPFETRRDILMTIKLLGKIKPGRFRWSIFFPYVHTEAYALAREGGYIDEEKRVALTNFFEESCLDFGPELNLWIDKLQKIFPWYVNAYAHLPVSPSYADLVQEVEKVPLEKWSLLKEQIPRRDREVSDRLAQNAQLHYAIRYNAFMGVRSDYFLKEETNREC